MLKRIMTAVLLLVLFTTGTYAQILVTSRGLTNLRDSVAFQHKLDSLRTGSLPVSIFGMRPIVGTDTMDNYPIMAQLTSLLGPGYPLRFDRSGQYWFSQTVTPQKAVVLLGPDSYEMNPTVQLVFPKGDTGFAFTKPAAAGSFVSGLTINSVTPESGRILEYNPDDGRGLIITPIFALTPGKTFQFRDAYTPDKIKGTAVISSVSTNNIGSSLIFTRPSGTFHVGDTLKGAVSNVKAVIRFVSRFHNAVAVGTYTGVYIYGEKLTDIATGDTARFVSRPASNFAYARVITVGSTTGSLDGVSDTTTLTPGDSTQYNVSGTIDSTGATGMRTSIFVENGCGMGYGVFASRRLTLDNIRVIGFSTGILINSAGGNANLVRLHWVLSNVNAANGVQCIGGDANAFSFSQGTLVNNVGFGFLDLSFLGGDVDEVHSSSSMIGGYSSANYINRRTLYKGVYSEGGYSLAPWTPVANYVGGNSGFLGGTHGQVNKAPFWRTDGYSGFHYSGDEMYNKYLYIDKTVPRDPKIVIKGGGTMPSMRLEAQGNSGAGRGFALTWAVPLAGGWEGPNEIHTTSMDGIQLLGTINSAAYEMDFRFRKSLVPPIALTTTTGRGQGGNVTAEIQGGKVVKVNVLSGGRYYPLNGTTATMPNPSDPSGRPAILNVLVADSVIYGVEVLDSGSLYKDNDFYAPIAMDGNGNFFPFTNATGSLGTPSRHWKVLYVDSIVSAPGTVQIPTYLQAEAPTPTGSKVIASLRVTGNVAPDRGGILEMGIPYGTGVSNITAQIRNLWQYNSAYHSMFSIATGDSASDMRTHLWLTHNGALTLGDSLPQSSVRFEVYSATRGSLPAPRMSSTLANAIAAKAHGLLIFNTDKSKYWRYDSTLAQYHVLAESDTSAITDGSVLVGDATNGRFNKKTITGTGGVSVTATPSGGIVVDGSSISSGVATTPVMVTVSGSSVVNTTVTPSDITGLGTSLLANTRYAFEANIQATTTGTGGIKYQLLVPTGSVYYLQLVGTTTTTAAAAWNVYNYTGSLTETGAFAAAAFGGGSAIASLHITGFIQTGSTAGTAQLQFRSGTAGETKTILIGSNMVLTKTQ